MSDLLAMVAVLSIPVWGFIVPYGFWVHRHPSRAAYRILYLTPHVALWVVLYGILAFAAPYCCRYPDEVTGAVFVIVGSLLVVTFYAWGYNAVTALYMFLLRWIAPLFRKKS